MGTMLDNEALTGLVDRIVREQFSDTIVHAVRAKPGLDHDGDAILRVTVVVQDGVERLDPEKVVKTLGLLWSELGDAGNESFPIVSYRTRADDARLKHEPV